MQNRICQVRPSGSRKLRLETKGLFVCVCQLLTFFLSFPRPFQITLFFFFLPKLKTNTTQKQNSILYHRQQQHYFV